MAKHAAGPQLLSAAAQGPVERQWALLAFVHSATEVTAEVLWVRLAGRFGVELGALGHAQRHHEGALDFDFDVRQRVKELLVGAVVEAERRAVRPSYRHVGRHGGVEEQRVAWTHGETRHSHLKALCSRETTDRAKNLLK